MTHIVILILVTLVGFLLSILPTFIWSIKYGKKYITADLLPLRKRYRTVSASGFILLIVSLMTLMEALGILEENGFEWMLLPALFMSNYKIFFEPYYTTDVVDKIDDFCLYLRPFISDAKLDLNWKTETLEKVLCGKFEKYIARCYCIGDPNSAMPTTLRTSGIYASDADWKDAVNSLADKSKVILLRVMETEGCLWEIGQCISRHLEKTIFLVDDSRYFDLLKEFIAARNIDVPEVAIINENSIMALYYCNGKWRISVIKKKRDVESMINDYLKQHEELETEIKNKKRLATILKAPFKPMEIPNKWVHYICFSLSPAWYIVFNAWPILWIVIVVVYYFGLMVPMAVFAAVYEEYYLMFGIVILSLLPFAWLAPRISMAFNRPGSKFLTDRINRVLLKWVGVYMVLIALLSFCVPYEDEEETTYTVSESCEMFAEDILKVQLGYKGYVAVETKVDSAFTSVYTDEQVRNALIKCDELFLKSDEDTYDVEMFCALADFYQAVDNVAAKDPEFVGWNIFQRFQCSDNSGESVEHACLLIADKELDSCFVFALDGNTDFVNFFEISKTIDGLLSEESIEEFNIMLENLMSVMKEQEK